MHASKFQVRSLCELPIKVYGHACAYDNENHKMYVFGGISKDIELIEEDDEDGMGFRMDWSNQLISVDMISMKTEVVEVKRASTETFSSIPEPRLRSEMVYYDGKLFMLGGNSQTLTFGLDKIDYFDIASACWVQEVATKGEQVGGIEDFPRPRCRFGHALYRDRYLFIVGGEDLGSSVSLPYKDCWRLDLATLQWKFIAFLPTETSFHSCAITEEGCLYVFGGKVFNEDTRRGGASEKRVSVRTNKTFRLWVDVPKLSTLARNALGRTETPC